MLSGDVLGQVLSIAAPLAASRRSATCLIPSLPKICMTSQHGVGQELVRSSTQGRIPSGWCRGIELTKAARRSCFCLGKCDALSRFQPLPNLALVGVAAVGLAAGWRHASAVLAPLRARRETLFGSEVYTWDFAHQTVPFIFGRLSEIETNPSFYSC